MNVFPMIDAFHSMTLTFFHSIHVSLSPSVHLSYCLYFLSLSEPRFLIGISFFFVSLLISIFLTFPFFLSFFSNYLCLGLFSPSLKLLLVFGPLSHSFSLSLLSLSLSISLFYFLFLSHNESLPQMLFFLCVYLTFLIKFFLIFSLCNFVSLCDYLHFTLLEFFALLSFSFKPSLSLSFREKFGNSRKVR